MPGRARRRANRREGFRAERVSERFMGRLLSSEATKEQIKQDNTIIEHFFY
jgi:hypothetical protein